MIDKKILIIEDDEIFSATLNEYLLLKKFNVAVAGDGQTGIKLYQTFAPDLILLDVLLPEMNGIEVAKNIRIKDQVTPILFMSSSENSDESQIRSFCSGGNDHLDKGFHLDVLHYKIIDRLKSHILPENNIFQRKIGNGILTISNSLLTYNEYSIEIIEREEIILKILFESPNEIVTRDEIIKAVWNYVSNSNDHMLNNYIKTIKDKLLPLKNILEVKPVYGRGYMVKINPKK